MEKVFQVEIVKLFIQEFIIKNTLKIKAMYRRQQKTLSRFVKNIPFGIKNVEN